jgi:hypothetical protein
MLNSLTTICLIYFWEVRVKYKLFSNTHIRIDEATSNYLRFKISMDYHFRDNQKRQLCSFFFFFFFFFFFLGSEGITS